MININKNNSKLAALHVCYLAPGNQSGYETRVIEETSLLRKSGFGIIIACFINRNKNQFFPPLKLWKFYRRLKKTTNAKIHIFPTPKYFDMHTSPEGITEIVDQIAELANRHEVNIIHGQALYSMMHALRAKVKTRAKIVFDVHGATPEETEMSGGHANRVKLLENWEKEALRTADLRIFVSKKMKTFFDRKYGFSNLPYLVMPCCVHPDRFRMQHDTRLRRKSKLDLGEKFVVMYLGTLSVWQWPKAMFALFRQIYKERPDAVLYLLIPHYDHEKALAYLQDNNLPKSSYLIQEVPHSDVGNYIGIADLGLLLRESSPVNYVSSPTKFGEYVAAGVPVIATKDIGDVSGMIENNKVGMIISASDDGVSADELTKIVKLIEDISARRKEWSQRCENTAQTLLDWNNHVNMLADAYQRITLTCE